MKTNLALFAICVLGFQLRAQVSFINSSTLTVGNYPDMVTVADVNGDGTPDLINVNQFDNTLSVWTNDGSGSFLTVVTYSVGVGPNSVAAADVNGDGKLDLISANQGGNTLTVLTNNGSGVFGFNATLTVGNSPFCVIAADVNGDGKVDLISANEGNNTLTVLTNNGSGVFGFSATLPVGTSPVWVVAADVNGDGKMDLISANDVGNTLTVLTNNGSGVFGFNATLPVGNNPDCVTAADVNGDGKLDLISVNDGDNTLTVLTNNGSGVFGFNATLTAGTQPTSVTAADVNGDGKLDLICANYGDDSLIVLTNNGNGGFATAGTFAVGVSPYCIVAADVNGDGKLDLISANAHGNTLTVLTNATPFPPATLPVITAQPISSTNVVGGTASFRVSVTVTSGPALFSYQWQLAGTNLPAATNNPLVLPNLTLSQAGSYDVVVADAAGSVTSSPAFLNVQFIGVNVNGQPDIGTATAVAPVIVTIVGGYPGGFLFYTLDGSTPSTSSTLYSGPIILINSAVVSVMSLSSDFTQMAYSSPVNVQVIPIYNLQTSIIGSGTLSTNPPNGSYASNSVVTLTATAALHWAFDHWTGDVTGTNNPISVTMNGPRSVQAVFVQNAFPLTLTTPGGGNVTANGSIISPATFYPTGTVVSIVATASNGWSFLGWQGSASGTNNPLNITINQTNIIQAMFGTVAAINSLGGVIVMSQPNPIPYGTSLTVSAVPDPGNYFVTWFGNVSGTNAPTRITVTSASPSITALFAPLPAGKYTLSVVVNGNGFVTNNPQRNYYNPGDTVTVRATNNAGAFFFGWAQDATGTGNPLTVLMTTNKTIQANFGVAPTVSVSPSNLTILAGGFAVLTANAFGLPPLTYQWQNSQGPVAGATNAIFIFQNTQPTNAGNYFVVVTNSSGSVTSSVATVTVIGMPTITNQPPPQTVVTSGHTASFMVGAYGSPALAYQWQFNGANLSGATSAALTLQNAYSPNAGNYSVVITYVFGSITSNPALLTVLPLGITAPTMLAHGQFQLSFDTATGVDYEVDYSTNLADWYPLTTVGGNGAPLTVIDPNTAGSPQRFYRIIQSPP